ncbi:hypothetical protein MW887_007443 [Aspergillus wentii]|nr:hypothetical protein MW887_007443 [Aspergillus wentii]
MGLFNWIITIIGKFLALFRPKDSDVYGLDHAILNIELPTRMWMNLGYWKHESALPQACKALLDQVLITAGLLDENGRPIPPHAKKTTTNIVDVGFGCGDQSLYLTQLSYSPSGESHDGDTDSRSGSGSHRPLFSSYVGITITESQAEFARQRMAPSMHGKHHLGNDERSTPTPTPPPSMTSSASTGGLVTPNIHLFCADAAKPATWSAEVKHAIRNEAGGGRTTSRSSATTTTTSTKRNTYLLALDTLYHFRPSRKPLVEYACSHLQASIMAFDLVLADDASVWSKLLMRVICWVSGTPFSNFLTWGEYEEMLVGAGYEQESITARDLSEHVFSGIERYIRRQDEMLRPFGMGVGKFKGAGKVFGWWARSGVVRGMVIVAKK